MPELSSTAQISAESETLDVEGTDVRIIYAPTVLIEPGTQADATLIGKNQVIDGSALSEAVTTATSRLIQYSTATIEAATESELLYSRTIPIDPAPIGELFLDGKPLKGQRIRKGVSFAVSFSIQGFKLVGLQIKFKLKTLKGRTLVEKKSIDSPGGISIEEFLTNPLDRSQSITGSISFLPGEIDPFFLESSREIESHYEFSIGNKLNRRYILACDFVNFYDC